MKKYKNLILEIWIQQLQKQLLSEEVDKKLLQKVIQQLHTVQDNKILKFVLSTIVEPLYEQKFLQLFAKRSIPDKHRNNMGAALIQHLKHVDLDDELKLDFIDQMIEGKAFRTKELIDGSLMQATNIKSYRNHKCLQDDKFFNWFFAWSPQIASQAVGEGEVFLVLNDKEGSKGGSVGKGDAYLGNNYMIELKQGAGTGANFIPITKTNANFAKGKQVLIDYLKKYNIEDYDIDTMGLGKQSGKQTISKHLNNASIPLSKQGMTDSQLDTMWTEICKASLGQSKIIPFTNTTKNGITDVNRWASYWQANALDVYKQHEGFTHLFVFDRDTKNCISFRNGKEMIKAYGKGNINCDYTYSWQGCGMNYEQISARVRYTNSREDLQVQYDVSKTKQHESKLALQAIYNFLSSNKFTGKAKVNSSKQTREINLPDNLFNELYGKGHKKFDIKPWNKIFQAIQKQIQSIKSPSNDEMILRKFIVSKIQQYKQQ